MLFATAQVGARDDLRGRIEEKVRRELVRLVGARIAETQAERAVELEAPLARALGLAGAGPAGREALRAREPLPGREG
ncbi:hypothetical protein WMF26_40050 [Sorangium sp. So ce185]|uniref:hypothetical protein n=1 Tax=Sorangium sp. So ce185 TaxID=3133287 RepID=UPI003F5E7091